MSVNHQFIEFSEQVVKRYVKVGIGGLAGWRLNPRNAVNSNERIDWLLQTPEKSVTYHPYTDEQATQVVQTSFSYEDEVLELYSEREVIAFERMNRLLIENGLLVEFSEKAPEVDRTNALSDTELQRIARMKTTANFQQRVTAITSVNTLQALLDAIEQVEDVKYSHVKFVKARINELNKR
jgi:hypothetical protein